MIVYFNEKGWLEKVFVSDDERKEFIVFLYKWKMELFMVFIEKKLLFFWLGVVKLVILIFEYVFRFFVVLKLLLKFVE